LNCPRCCQPLPHLAIRGAAYRAVKKTRIPKRYIDVNDDEVLYVLPIPLLVLEPKTKQKGTENAHCNALVR
jgi:hypothetical protein